VQCLPGGAPYASRDIHVARPLRTRFAGPYPECPWLNGDIDHDGGVGFDDINPFVNCLVLGACP
jgi:hypothetical protein